MSEKFVKNILDVPGVEGVCVIDREGQVIDNHLPSFFIEELFDDLARRVISLYETVDENFVPCDDYLLKYSDRWLFLRRGTGIFLLVLASADVNRVSLKMVTNLAIKNIKVSKMPTPSAARSGAMPAPVASKTSTAPKMPATPAEPPAAAEPDSTETAAPTRKRVPRPRPSRSYRGNSY